MIGIHLPCHHPLSNEDFPGVSYTAQRSSQEKHLSFLFVKCEAAAAATVIALEVA